MESHQRYDYRWPETDLAASHHWQTTKGGNDLFLDMPEDPELLRIDSRWPAMFPSPTCFVTTADSARVALEKVVGASIVNRFPYVLALSLCRRHLSDRHHDRRAFRETLEHGRNVAVQFLPRGEAMNRALAAVSALPEDQTHLRIAHSGLSVRGAATSDAPVFNESYLVYEGRLARPATDFDGRSIYGQPWADVGSHRVYFLEVRAIQLRADIATGRSRILWRGLPAWRPIAGANRASSIPSAPHDSEGAAELFSSLHSGSNDLHAPSGSEKSRRLNPAARNTETGKAPVAGAVPRPVREQGGFAKSYTPDYEFPTPGTVAFEADGQWNGMAVKLISPEPDDRVESDNDRARWPCFFPSPVGMITTWTPEGAPNLMPCGSTTVVSRNPLVIAPCVSYAAINDRYKPRRTLEAIRRTGHFGCGVPYNDDRIVDAIRYAGTCSIDNDPNKVANSGLAVEAGAGAPRLVDLPIHFSCRVVGEVRLGTHMMFLGEVYRIRVRGDVTPENPLHWCPWPDVATGDQLAGTERIVKGRSAPLTEVTHVPSRAIVDPKKPAEVPSPATPTGPR